MSEGKVGFNVEAETQWLGSPVTWQPNYTLLGAMETIEMEN